MSANRRLGGENISPRLASQARALIGKRVEFLRNLDIDKSGRCMFFPRRGTVESVHGRNFCVSGDWVHFSECVEMRLLGERE